MPVVYTPWSVPWARTRAVNLRLPSEHAPRPQSGSLIGEGPHAQRRGEKGCPGEEHRKRGHAAELAGRGLRGHGKAHVTPCSLLPLHVAKLLGRGGGGQAHPVRSPWCSILSGEGGAFPVEDRRNSFPIISGFLQVSSAPGRCLCCVPSTQHRAWHPWAVGQDLVTA